MEYALFRTYKGLYFGGGIEFHAKPAAVEGGHGLTQLRNAGRRLVTVGIGAARFLTQAVYGLRRRRHVGTADGQRYDVFTFGIEAGHFLAFPREVIFLYAGQTVGGNDFGVIFLHILQGF